ncbi:phage antirepressor protein, partial [Candidatus Woesearchaeota archaeon]|nr:phage antirepressor protein [Candidatus Woesearchaeota archaeon]
NAAGFDENKTAAADGGEVAGNARKETERKTGKKVVSKQNYLDAPEKVKRKQLD